MDPIVPLGGVDLSVEHHRMIDEPGVAAPTATDRVQRKSNTTVRVVGHVGAVVAEPRKTGTTVRVVGDDDAITIVDDSEE